MALRLEILFFFVFFGFLVFCFFGFLVFCFFGFLVWVAIAHVPSIIARNYEWLQRSVCGRNMCKKQCKNCTARVSPSVYIYNLSYIIYMIMSLCDKCGNMYTSPNNIPNRNSDMKKSTNRCRNDV